LHFASSQILSILSQSSLLVEQILWIMLDLVN